MRFIAVTLTVAFLAAAGSGLAQHVRVFKGGGGPTAFEAQ
jgi:hypothetical protein